MSIATSSLFGTNLALPSNLNTTAKPATTSSNTTSSTSSSADGGLGSTFLSLLSQELQNQDPTAPVDSTAMVGQMISLNQLDQLINISSSVQTIASGTGSTTPTTSGQKVNGAAPASTAATPAANVQPGTAAAANYQLPFDPNTMMPVNMQNPGSPASTTPAVSGLNSITK